MTFAYAVLLAAIFIALAGHITMWVLAYQEVKNRESWSQQARALNAWWLFDKELLPKDRDHLRIKALYCLAIYTLSSGILWYLHSQQG